MYVGSYVSVFGKFISIAHTRPVLKPRIYSNSNEFIMASVLPSTVAWRMIELASPVLTFLKIT